MKNKHKPSRIIILILSCFTILLSIAAGFILIYRLGSFSAAEKLIFSQSFSEFRSANNGRKATGDPRLKPSSAVSPTPSASLYPDVTIACYSPCPDFVLPISASNASVYETPADVVDSAKNGVVSILNYHYNTKTGNYFAFGSSSGFIVSDKGYILTNAHAVSNAKRLEVSFFDQTSVDALMVGFDLTTDIAVIKIPEESVSCVLPLGNSDQIRVGEYVLAIGNPLSSDNLYGTVSLGIVSGKDRAVNIDGFTNNFIQTDAALNPGNSGGPLLNMCGSVVGMNTAKAISAGYDDYGNSISSEGIGFSLPINDVAQIANILIQHGEIPRPGIGITVYTLDAENAETLKTVVGVYVDSVNSGSPADIAGMKAGDVIVKFNDISISDQDQLIELVKAMQIGGVSKLTVFRNGEYIELSVSIGNMNDFNNK